MTTYTSRDGNVIDGACRRFYGREAGAVEAVLEANLGLDKQGSVLPARTEVHLPELARPLERIATMRLWD